MPTRIVDTSLHVAAFPLGYTGPGTLIGNCVNSGGEACDVYGFFTSDGNAVQINVGFQALQVDIVDTAGVLAWRWQWGMPASNSLKNAAGAMTVDTTAAITCAVDLAGNGIVTLSAAMVGSGKGICYHVQG